MNCQRVLGRAKRALPDLRDTGPTGAVRYGPRVLCCPGTAANLASPADERGRVPDIASHQTVVDKPRVRTEHEVVQ